MASAVLMHCLCVHAFAPPPPVRTARILHADRRFGGRLHARMGDDVSVAMQVNEGDVVRFRTKSSIQAGFTEGIPLALSLVDALQLILPEPGNQIQHEHGYVYGRLLEPVPNNPHTFVVSEQDVQIPPEDLVDIIEHTAHEADGIIFIDSLI